MAKRSRKKPSPLPVAVADRKTDLLRVGVIVGLVIAIYFPVLHGDWLWDDKELISRNPLIHDPSGWWKIWAQPNSLVDFYPVTVTVEWLQWHAWGANTLGFHLVNVALHVVSALLVWRLLEKLDLRLAWIGGLLFAIHPAQVESVAWMAELKNTLSLPPFLLAACAYLDFDAQGRRRDYLFALGFFLLAMLCKATMTMFPVVILLYVWWKRGRIQAGDLKAAAPFFALSLVLGVITIWFQQQHAIHDRVVFEGGLLDRAVLAGDSLAVYLFHVVWPFGLLPIYPKWTLDPPGWLDLLPGPVLAALIFIVWRKRASWERHLLLGFGFFVIMLAPLLGLTDTFFMSFSWVVDHNLYLPMIGFAGLLAAGCDWADRRLMPSFRWIGIAVLVLACGLLAYESRSYAARFTDQETLWTYTLARNPEAWPAHNNLGNYLLDHQRPVEAEAHYRHALLLSPNDPNTHNNLGNALEQTGRNQEAIAEYLVAVNLSPTYVTAIKNLALAYTKENHFPEALELYLKAEALDPNDASTHNNLGWLYSQMGRPTEAAREYGFALKDDPNYDAYRRKLDELRRAEKATVP